jgi:hypothetical protein
MPRRAAADDARIGWRRRRQPVPSAAAGDGQAPSTSWRARLRRAGTRVRAELHAQQRGRARALSAAPRAGQATPGALARSTACPAPASGGPTAALGRWARRPPRARTTARQDARFRVRAARRSQPAPRRPPAGTRAARPVPRRGPPPRRCHSRSHGSTSRTEITSFAVCRPLCANKRTRARFPSAARLPSFEYRVGVTPIWTRPARGAHCPCGACAELASLGEVVTDWKLVERFKQL